MCMCLDAEQQPELYRVRVICNVCVSDCVCVCELVCACVWMQSSSLSCTGYV